MIINQYEITTFKNRVYKEQTNCTNCGLQLRDGVGKSFFRAVIHYGLYIGVGLVIFLVIYLIVTALIIV